MIVQACLNGARPAGYHPNLPFTAEAIAQDGAACIAAGAAELHIHPRDADGRESLSTVSAVVNTVRAACPGTLLGVSTGAWIEEDEQKTRDCIAAWTALPDYASVNLSEPDAPTIIALLHEIGVGVEAGLASRSDANGLWRFQIVTELSVFSSKSKSRTSTRPIALPTGFWRSWRAPMFEGLCFCTASTRPSGTLSNGHIINVCRHGSGWKMAAG